VLTHGSPRGNGGAGIVSSGARTADECTSADLRYLGAPHGLFVRTHETSLEETNLRKTLIAAIAATTVLGGGAIARAQIPADDASMKVTVAPQKAGTKKKPANTSLRLAITNKNTHRTASKLAFQFPKTIAINGKGLKSCNKSQFEASTDESVCPKASKVGVGTATAYLGVDQPSPQRIDFDVTAYLVGKNKIDFLVVGGAIRTIAKGTLKQTSKGPKLTIDIPQAARQIGPPDAPVYNGLGSLDTVIKKQIGKHKLISTTGCKKHKHAVSAVVTFIDNPATEAGKLPLKAAAKCR
jgi:hypothetical protein